MENTVDNNAVSVNLPEGQEFFFVFFNGTIEEDGIKAGCLAIVTKVAENCYAIYHSNTSKNLKGKEYDGDILDIVATSRGQPRVILHQILVIIRKTGRTPDGKELKEGAIVVVRLGGVTAA
ncbi:MAG: hypothetical protein ACOX3T_05480 [Bdellovibrionota bacterium]